jgi:hypothetical protein
LLTFFTKVASTRPGIDCQNSFREKIRRRLYSATDDIHYGLGRFEAFRAEPILLLLAKLVLAYFAQEAPKAFEMKRIGALGKVSTIKSGIPAVALTQTCRGTAFLTFFFLFEIAQNYQVRK